VGKTLIVSCSHCGGLFLAGEDQKTRTCPYCGWRVELKRAKKLSSAENAFEASKILKKLKSRGRVEGLEC
jgi:DNA-directed RNA polymerase subunit RPC12/RpoP